MKPSPSASMSVHYTQQLFSHARWRNINKWKYVNLSIPTTNINMTLTIP
jgi:hypothetical protein